MANPQNAQNLGEELPVPIGALISNRYRIVDVIGAGGMAFVLAARDEETERPVALKILRPELAQFDVAKARFLREAGAAARIKSEYVAEVFDVGTTDEGLAFIVMEHLEGQTLEELMHQRGALPVEEAVDYTLEALEALAHAHALGVVHRDIKPANLFAVRGADGSLLVKILDFGISKTNPLVSARRQLTVRNAVLGSPAYMSPEQARSSTDVDQRTDIWSLGVILYELLAARPPFEGDTPVRIITSISKDAPKPLRQFRPDVPEALEAVVLRCLERNLDLRFANAAELGRALAPFASEQAKALPDQIARASLEAFPYVRKEPPPAASEDSSIDLGPSAEADSAQPKVLGDETPPHADAESKPSEPALGEQEKEALKKAGEAKAKGISPKKKKLNWATLILWAALLIGLMMIARAAWKMSHMLLHPKKAAPASSK